MVDDGSVGVPTEVRTRHVGLRREPTQERHLGPRPDGHARKEQAVRAQCEPPRLSKRRAAVGKVKAKTTPTLGGLGCGALVSVHECSILAGIYHLYTIIYLFISIWHYYNLNLIFSSRLWRFLVAALYFPKGAAVFTLYIL